jgi:hypothetical protein
MNFLNFERCQLKMIGRTCAGTSPTGIWEYFILTGMTGDCLCPKEFQLWA